MSATALPATVAFSDAVAPFARPLSTASAAAFDSSNGNTYVNTGLEHLLVVSTGTATLTINDLAGNGHVTTLANGKTYVFAPLPVSLFGSNPVITPSTTAGTIAAFAPVLRASGAVAIGGPGHGGGENSTITV